VSANRALRGAMATRMQELGLPLHIPPLYLCTDNAAMIGAAAHARLRTAATPFAALDLDVFATLPLATA
jgi:N6-L-threonylcarbamoyladenine synthase